MKQVVNQMLPVPFMELVEQAVMEYRDKGSLFGVPVVINTDLLPVGPAAGPHTQMAQNLVAAYGAGATVFELKTVQILEGEALGIVKPCIYVGSEVYNTEWSTELTVEEAAAEYIKAQIIIQVLSKEFGLTPFEDLEFVMSVGYDFDGISSQKIDRFIESMKDAKDTTEWKNDIKTLKENTTLFDNVSAEDIEEFTSKVCDTVTLSTMHGCPAKDIERIGKYLIATKKLNTYIKMNPTLLGKDEINRILSAKGYDVLIPDEIFDADIDIDAAIGIIRECQKTAYEEDLVFGIKLTNTLPVKIRNNELSGGQMYMSGAGLYALSINTAKIIADRLEGRIKMSYSGGIDESNIKEVLETGIAPVTVSSYLLKPGGYKNIGKLLVEAYIPGEINLEKLTQLSEYAISDTTYDCKQVRIYKEQERYDKYCSVCHNCEDVCPNRANRRVVLEGKEVVIHNPNLCNECGACYYSCLMGHKPYLEKAVKD